MTAEAGYSGTPLLKKLGVKPGMRALLISIPNDVTALAEFAEWKSVRRQGPANGALKGPFDYIHMFTADRARFAEAAPRLRAALDARGLFWASWPKKSSGVASTLFENDVRDIAFAAGLVDVKVCAIDAVWSGLKLVVPVKDRAS